MQILNLPATPDESAEKGAQSYTLAGDTDLDEIFSDRMLNHGTHIRIQGAVEVKWLETPKAEVSAATVGHSLTAGQVLVTRYRNKHFQLSGTGAVIIHILTGEGPNYSLT